MNPARSARRSHARRSRQVAALSAFALSGLFSTYVAAVRPAVTYAAQPGRIQPRTAGCPSGSTEVATDTALRTAVAASTDDSVICVTSSFALTAPVTIDDTSLTLTGADDSVSLVVPSGQAGIDVNLTGAADNVVTISQLSLGRTAGTSASGVRINMNSDDTVLIADSRFSGLRGGTPSGADFFGGAIFARGGGSLTVSNSHFADNSASHGGAIWSDDSVSIVASEFQGNEATILGGSMYLTGALAASIYDSIFTDDSVGGNGGSVFSYVPLTVTNSSFTDGFAGSYAGAIYADDTVAIQNSTFARNEALDRGGSLYLTGAATIASSTFDGDSAVNDGGSIFATAPIQISSAFFVNGQATNIGGAIYANDTISVVASAFEQNDASVRGGALYLTGSEASITETLFDDNSSARGGAVWSDDTTIIADSYFLSNEATGRGGSLYLGGLQTANISSTTFLDDSSGDDGGSIRSTVPLNIADSSFTGAYAADLGGAVSVAAITAAYAIRVETSTFAANTAVDDGGAIHARGKVLVDSATFAGNSGASGGAIFAQGSEVRLVNSALVGNDADDEGGAVYLYGDDTAPHQLDAINSSFVGNSARNHGGAAFAVDASAVLLFSTFLNNQAGDGAVAATYGAAVVAGSPGWDDTVVNSIFVNNTLDDTTRNPNFGAEVSLVGTNVTFANVSFSDDTSWVGTGVTSPTWVDDSFIYATPASMGLDDTVGDWGGPTPTVRLSSTSPVATVGAGSALVESLFGAGSFPATDQRGAGFPRVVNGLTGLGAFQPAAAAPTPTPTPTAPSAPRDVIAVAGDASAVVSWHVPAAQGSFPVTRYEVVASPGGRVCLVSETSCEITGLTNGTAYTFTVRALSGAGWGATSAPSAPVTPQAPARASIVISGSREKGNARYVRVSGVTTALVSELVTPWVKFPGQSSYKAGSVPRVVASDGTFTWQRKTGKKTYVYFTHAQVRSNTVTIPAR